MSKVQQKFAEARNVMSSALIEREGEVDLVLTAMLCKEHPLLVGAPGSAKSMLLDALVSWLNLPSEDKFNIVLNKFTTPEEVVGPLDVPGYVKNREYKRITKGFLPTAKIAFMDEIWKGSSAILNINLKIIHERKFRNGDKDEICPLRTLVAASNEWPGEDNGGKELGALFDRFLFRKEVKYIESAEGRQRLCFADQMDLIPHFTDNLSLAELDTACDEVKYVDWSDAAAEKFQELWTELNQNGIFPGDRRVRKSITACQAFAYLNEEDTVLPEHLEILCHTMWVDPIEQPKAVAKIVLKVANPSSMAIGDKLNAAQSVVSKCLPGEAAEKLKAIRSEIEAISSSDGRVKRALKTINRMIKDCAYKAAGIREG